MSVLPQVVTRNWRLKLSAFILSVFLWTIVSLQPRNREIFPTVPVEVVLNDPNWTLAEAPTPMTVSVHLGGIARDLLGLSLARATTVEVPIDQVIGADTIVRLRPEWVRLSGGSNVVVQSITPSAIALRFEPTVSAAVPLSLRTRGELPDGLALVQPLTLSPQVATVRGPSRVLEALDSLPLVALDLRDLTASGTYRVAVDSEGLGNLTFQPGSVQVAVNLQASAERVLSDVPVVVEAPPGVDSTSLVVNPATVQVTLRGALTLLEQTTPLDVVAVVAARDLLGIAAGNEWSVPIRLRGMSALLSARPDLDSVRVLRAPNAPAAPAADSGSGRDTTAPRDTAAPPGPAPRDTAAPRGTAGPRSPSPRDTTVPLGPAVPPDTAAPGRSASPPRGRGGRP